MLVFIRLNLSCIVPPSIQPANGLSSHIAVKDSVYIIKFFITEDHPVVENCSIQWWYQKDLASTAKPLPPWVENETQQQERHSLSHDGRSLTIRDVQIIDGGLYTIRATNLAGRRSKTVSLTVHGKT